MLFCDIITENWNLYYFAIKYVTIPTRFLSHSTARDSISVLSSINPPHKIPIYLAVLYHQYLHLHYTIPFKIFQPGTVNLHDRPAFL